VVSEEQQFSDRLDRDGAFTAYCQASEGQCGDESVDAALLVMVIDFQTPSRWGNIFRPSTDRSNLGASNP
jgi:hypothetical protein